MLSSLTRWLHSPSAWNVVAGVMPRIGAVLLTILVGRVHGLDSLGEWTLGQTLSLALLGAVGLALGQLLIAERMPETGLSYRQARFGGALLVGLVLSATLIVFVQFVVWRPLSDHLGVPSLPEYAWLAVWVYTAGNMAYLLASSHLLACEDTPSLRRLGVVGLVALVAMVWLAEKVGPWILAATVGALLMFGSLTAVGRDGPIAWSELRKQAGRLLRLAWPLMLGNACVNPAVFFSAALVGTHGGLAAAGLYGIGNQWRNLFLLPVSLVLPVYLHRLARGGAQSRHSQMTLGLVAVGCVTGLVVPEPMFKVFSLAPLPADTVSVLRSALLSVPFACLANLLGQQLVVRGMVRTALGLNLIWCAALFAAYLILQRGAVAALAMTQANLVAYVMLCLGALYACRRVRQ